MAKVACVLAMGLSIVAMMTILNFSQYAAAEQLAYTPPRPYFVNLQGDTITTTESGQQIIIMNTFANYDKNPRDYLALIEVRDSNGVTIFIALQTTTMPRMNAITGALGESTIGVSWSTTEPGQYQVRAFAVTGLNDSQILSPIQEAVITAR